MVWAPELPSRIPPQVPQGPEAQPGAQPEAQHKRREAANLFSTAALACLTTKNNESDRPRSLI